MLKKFKLDKLVYAKIETVTTKDTGTIGKLILGFLKTFKIEHVALSSRMNQK